MFTIVLVFMVPLNSRYVSLSTGRQTEMSERSGSAVVKTFPLLLSEVESFSLD
uniref:Uncharacterized protein n=1 Tax=Picea glauca TaxID=3330 RepID=A0A101LUK0_PICGL|nr:hypothetical protein ABT39_MTgene2446 [Picea glauca]